MSQQSSPLQVNGPSDLVAVVPRLLGFAPASSLVVVGINENNLECTFRVDLPERAEDAAYVRDLAVQLVRNNCGQAVAIVYGAEPIALAVAQVTARRLNAAGITVLDFLRVDQGQYWSLTCDGPCCPPEGTPIPELPAVVLTLISEGSVARPNREDVAALLDPASDGSRAAVASNVGPAWALFKDEQPTLREGSGIGYLGLWMEQPELLPWPAAIALIGVTLTDTLVRDRLLCRIAADPDNARLDLWVWVTRHLEGELVAAAATVAGFAAYRTGNGVLALDAFELALRADPSYRLAHMLLEANQAGLPPAALAAIGKSEEDLPLSG